MTSYVVLLRAVNVTGNNTLPMSVLKSICEEAGFLSVRTYIASGNVIFKSKKSVAQVKALLEPALAAHAGKPIGVLVRTAAEMAAVLAANPVPHTHPGKTVAIFLDEPPASDCLGSLKNHTQEELRLGHREIYVYYPDGQGQSRLIILAAKAGTARNLNTVAKLAELAANL